MDNRGALDQQLQETYGETIEDLNRASQNTRTARMVVRKLDVPPLLVTKIVKHVVPVRQTSKVWQTLEVSLQKPDVEAETVVVRKVYTPQEQPGKRAVLAQVEAKTRRYRIEEAEVEVALALIKPEGFKLGW